MHERSLIIRWFAAPAVCLVFLGACGSTAVEPETPEPTGSDVTTTAPSAPAVESDSAESTETTSVSKADVTVATTTTQPVATTTTSSAPTSTTTTPTTTSAPAPSTTAPMPTFEIETVEPDQELISTVSPSA